MTDKISDKQRRADLQEAVDLFITHGGFTAAAQHSGIPRTTLTTRFDTAMAEHFHPGSAALKAAGLKAPRSIPFSEDEKKAKNWTAKQCIDELMRIVKANPNEVITRNHFRVFSTISESTWTRHFGTFAEFKRQANVVPSRWQHRHEKAIAKHASVDHMRDLNLDKRAYEGKYTKPNDKRWQTILVGSDVHDRECDPFWRRIFIDAVRRVGPDIICLNGDMFDLPEFGKFTQDPRDWDVTGRIRWVHDFLSDIRVSAPDTQIDYVEGNHEFRLLRHLAEATPALRAVLSDLHGFTVSRLLGLDRYEINYIARMDLAAWTERDIKDELRTNYVNYFDAAIGHHFPEGRQMGFPGWNGHHHKHIVWAAFNPVHGAYEWHQLGSGHTRDATYCNGEKWANGFLLAHIDTQLKHTAFEYVEVRDHAIFGGQWYTRKNSEIVTPH